jgi:IclR family acetate operon transcriptional repressor
MSDSDGGVQSVRRAFELLEFIADAGDTVAVSALSVASGLPLPTVYRLLRTLVTMGYVRQLPSRRYALGPRLIRLRDTAGRALGAAAEPFLLRLVESTGETSNLAVLDGDMIVYMAQVPSKHSMRMFTEIGRRVLPHCTGVGKALLAQLSNDTVAQIVRRTGMPAQTDRTLTTVEALIADLDLIRSRGWAEDDGEQEVGVRCLAAAIPGIDVPAAVSISGPTARVTRDAAWRIAPVLLEVTADLAKAMNDGNR